MQNGTGTTSANQDVVMNNTGSATFNNPAGTIFAATHTTTIALTSGGVYTVSYTIMLADVQTLW